MDTDACDIPSLIVLIISGTAERGTALSAIKCCSEPNDIATTFGFFFAQPMNTGRSRSLDWGLSVLCYFVVSSKLVTNAPEAGLAVACSGGALASDFSAV